jgi:threonine dehydratase
MFHYRNHGAAYGRVLVGIQVPEHDKKHFVQCLDAIGYPYWDETENIAYQIFLAPEV